MADPIKKSPEQQANDIVENIKQGKKIEEPLTLEIQNIAREKAEKLEDVDKKKVIAALDALKKDIQIVTLNKDITTFDINGAPVLNKYISTGTKITLTLPAVDKAIIISGNNIVLTEVLVDNQKIWVQKNDLQGAIITPKEIISKQNKDITEIKEALKEINPNNLEKAIDISEKTINTLPDGETKTTLRGIHGAVIFDILRSAGHNLTIGKDKQIIIVPKPGTDVVNLQEKLQTLVNTGKLSIDTLKIGMLYSSPSFKAYSELKKVKDATGKDIIDPKANPQDFVNYLTDLKKAGNTSGDIETILGSLELLKSVDMQQAIRGFQDMGQVGKWSDNNLSAINTNLTSSVNSVNRTTSLNSTPSEPNNTLTGKVLKDGVTQGKVTGVVSDATQGLIHGIGDIMSLGKGDPLATLGIGAALIYGVYKAFGKFGFLGGLGALFGAGAMNNIEKIMGRFGVDVGDTAKKAKTAAEEAAEKAKTALTGATNPTSSNNTQKNAPALTQSQSDLRKKVEASGIATEVDKVATNKALNKPGKLDDYLKFIETDLKDVPLSKLFPSDHKKSIFFDNFDSEYSVDSKLSGKMLKKVLREYLTGNQTLTGTGDKLGESEKTTFLTLHKISPTDIQDKKLSDILDSVHKVRTGGFAPAHNTPAKTQNTQQNAPKNTPTVTSTLTKHKIGNMDIDVGKNVQILPSSGALVFDLNGQLYNNPQSKLPKDPTGKLHIPKDGVVKLGANVIKRSGVDHVEVEYAGEKVYIAITHLKP